MNRYQKKQLKALGKRIRARRVMQEMTQEGLAIKAGLDRAYYGGIERGERNISALNLIRIAIALRIEVGELFPLVEELVVISRSSNMNQLND